MKSAFKHGLAISLALILGASYAYAGPDDEIDPGKGGVGAGNIKQTNYLSRASCLLDSACFINYVLKTGEFQAIKDQVVDTMTDPNKTPIKLRYDRRFQIPNTENGGGIYNFMNKMYLTPVALSGEYNLGTVERPNLKKWCVWIYKPSRNDPSFIEVSDSFIRYSDHKRNGFYYLHDNKDLSDQNKASFPRKAFSGDFEDTLHSSKNAGSESFSVSTTSYNTPRTHVSEGSAGQSIYPTYMDDGNGDACPSHGGVFSPPFSSELDMQKFGKPSTKTRANGLNPRIFLAEGILDYLDKEVNDYAAFYDKAGLNSGSIKANAISMAPTEYMTVLNHGYNAKTPVPSASEVNIEELKKSGLYDYMKILYDLNDPNDVVVANASTVNNFKQIDGKRFAVENALRYYYAIGKLGENGKSMKPEARPIFIKDFQNPSVLYDPNWDSDLNKCAKRMGLNGSLGWRILTENCLIFDPVKAAQQPPQPPPPPPPPPTPTPTPSPTPSPIQITIGGDRSYNAGDMVMGYYLAFFGRVPEGGGYGHWMNQYGALHDWETIAQQMLDTPTHGPAGSGLKAANELRAISDAEFKKELTWNLLRMWTPPSDITFISRKQYSTALVKKFLNFNQSKNIWPSQISRYYKVQLTGNIIRKLTVYPNTQRNYNYYDKEFFEVVRDVSSSDTVEDVVLNIASKFGNKQVYMDNASYKSDTPQAIVDLTLSEFGISSLSAKSKACLKDIAKNKTYKKCGGL